MAKPSRSTSLPAIFVRATAPGTGGIATFVLDGWGLAAKLQPFVRAKNPLRNLSSTDLLYARMVDAKAQTIDELVIAFLGSDESATGFEQIELSCHGGIGSSAAVEELLLKAGFERGMGDELLYRATLNNKLSLIALEAQLRLRNAVTPRQAEFLLGHSEFQTRWERLGFDAAMGMRTRDIAWRAITLQAAREARAGFAAARALLRSHAVVLIGPVNAGKSTLANALAREDKHIVSAEPGTTRDRLDVRLNLRGLDLTLSDTAGLRVTEGEIEREGQRRANAAIESAALRVVVLDGSTTPTDADMALIARCKALGPVLLILNKEDLGINESAEGLGFLAGVEPLVLSAHTGSGIDRLEAAIESALLGGAVASRAAFTQRQADLLLEIQCCIENGWEETMTIRALTKMVGRRSNPEQLERVRAEILFPVSNKINDRADGRGKE